MEDYVTTRRVLLQGAAITGAALAAESIAGGHVMAQDAAPPPSALPATTATAGGGLLYPQQNAVRGVLDLSGLWDFQLDLKAEGEAAGWSKALPSPRPIAVPCSWNDLFDDAKNYLDLAWYRREVHVPAAWKGQRVCLRVGSANYAAKVWVNA